MHFRSGQTFKWDSGVTSGESKGGCWDCGREWDVDRGQDTDTVGFREGGTMKLNLSSWSLANSTAFEKDTGWKARTSRWMFRWSPEMKHSRKNEGEMSMTLFANPSKSFRYYKTDLIWVSLQRRPLTLWKRDGAKRVSRDYKKSGQERRRWFRSNHWNQLNVNWIIGLGDQAL